MCPLEALYDITGVGSGVRRWFELEVVDFIGWPYSYAPSPEFFFNCKEFKGILVHGKRGS